MSRRPCAHCQHLWSTQTMVTVGAAELCLVCYRLGRVTAPCWRCTPETGRTATCHDSCTHYEESRRRRGNSDDGKQKRTP